ncbi:MAG: DUF58 domain-containing protein [Oscillospiraceae bacterium]|nr:DUF58 domain-containing protein [Oscillospiraceae bacterium]
MRIIFSYFSILLIFVIFALFLDAPSGLFVIFILAAALILSSALHFCAVISFSCTLEADKTLIEKGEELRLVLRVKSRFPRLAFLCVLMPTAFRIKLALSDRFALVGENADTCTLTLSRREQEITLRLKAAYWGEANIDIDEIRAYDLLGVFSAFGKHGAKLKLPENVIRVRIYPAIPALSPSAEFVRALEDASAFDDNEQPREVLFATTGFPGYEHRDYVPGDSLKSVNWKLSAKRDKLMVRKPEAYAGGRQILLLDALKADGGSIAEEQLALEAMLALAAVLIKREIPCTVVLCRDANEGGWCFTELLTPDALEQLRLSLCSYSFSNSPPFGRLPDLADVSEASGAVIFTARPDEALSGVLEQIKQKDIATEVVAPIAGFVNTWQVSQITGEVVFRRNL